LAALSGNHCQPGRVTIANRMEVFLVFLDYVNKADPHIFEKNFVADRYNIHKIRLLILHGG